MNVNISSVSLIASTTAAISGFFSLLPLQLLGPCPSLPLPFDQQLALSCPDLLQFLHFSTSGADFSLPLQLCCFTAFGFLLRAASADSVIFVHLSLIRQCCASLIMKADEVTKALARLLFEKFRGMLGLCYT